MSLETFKETLADPHITVIGSMLAKMLHKPECLAGSDGNDLGHRPLPVCSTWCAFSTPSINVGGKVHGKRLDASILSS
jgi:hypothetical protein